jgi:hypothetical protein
MIVNGATKVDDIKHFNEQMKAFKGEVCFEYFHEQQLLALQARIRATGINNDRDECGRGLGGLCCYKHWRWCMVRLLDYG